MLIQRDFFMIRHGETDMNVRRMTSGGGVEAQLNDKGRAQAEKAAHVLAHMSEPPTLIIQSGMDRTRETTRIINQFVNLPVIEDNELREHMLGVWENKPWAEIFPLIDAGGRPEGGESAMDFAGRVRAALNKHLGQHDGERLLFVAHGGTFKSLQRMYGKPLRRCPVPNATIHRLSQDERYAPMPWRIDLLEWVDSCVKERASALCPSQPE